MGKSTKTYVDFETKKTIHFNITRETHSQLRIACFKQKLSMQELFEEISQKIASEDAGMLKIMDALSFKKRNKIIKDLSVSDAESLYNVIQEENPLSKL
jgi:Tfp pilus assembly ATPase PilU